MTKRFFTFLLFLLLLFITLMLMQSCSPTYRANRHLRIAERHIKKAEQLGASWSSDTLFKKISFTVPGADVKFSPKIMTAGKPMIFQKDSVITKVTIVPGKNGVDTVYVETKCPDRVITKLVPIEVTKTIQAEGKSFWQLLWQRFGYFFLGFITGVVACWIFLKGRTAQNLNINVRSEKPPN